MFFKITRDGVNFSLTVDQQQGFEVGQRVRYKSKKSGHDYYGLSNDGNFFGSDYAKRDLYKADDFSAQYGFMASFIEPTAKCEGQSFLSLNTYDRASFTFGFGQFAAHVPEGDFIRWFRDMLTLPAASQYFPDLSVEGPKIVRKSLSGNVVLADHDSTEKLRSYLNPSLNEVEDAEVIAAGKLMHWTVQDSAARALQVQHMVDTSLKYIKAADINLGLDGKGADLCCIVFDILHQGRGGYSDMRRSLADQDPFKSLLQIGAVAEPGRISNLEAALTPVRAEFRNLKWDRATQRFA